MKCKVCGNDFELLKENWYEVIEMGGFAATFRGETTTTRECFDCPKCGCQNTVNRKIRTTKKCEKGMTIIEPTS